MATVKEGIINGLKYSLAPALLATLISESDVNAGISGDRPEGIISSTGEKVGTLWDKGKVGATVLGTGALVGGTSEFIKNYMQDKAYGERVRAAQRAVLAQNNLLTQTDHKGDTKMVLPKRDMSITDEAVKLGVKAVDVVTRDAPKYINETASEVSKAHPIAGGAMATVGALGTGLARNAMVGTMRSAENVVRKFNPALLNSGTNPATRNFSEMPTYFIGSIRDSESMMGSLADMVKNRCCGSESLEEERLADFLGLYYPVAKTIFSDFSSRDFGILSAVGKGLTHGVSGLKKIRQFLPGKEGARAATQTVMEAGQKNSGKLADSFSKNIRETVAGKEGKVAKMVNGVADSVESAGKTVSAFFKTGAENPDVANKMVRDFKKGAVVAGVVTGSKLASKSQSEDVQPPAKNVG